MWRQYWLSTLSQTRLKTPISTPATPFAVTRSINQNFVVEIMEHFLSGTVFASAKNKYRKS